MRTKTLILSALVGLASGAALMAQTNVYSLNAVGYINLTCPAGFSMIANQLNTTNNTIASLLPAPQDGTMIYKFVGDRYATRTYSVEEGGWTPDGTMTMNPGEGVFIKIPGTSPTTITFVGEVMQGNLTNAMPTGFSVRSSMVPQAGGVDVLGFPAADGDMIYRYDPALGRYRVNVYSVEEGGWTPAIPEVAVGEAFFVKLNGPARDWVRNFSVNQ